MDADRNIIPLVDDDQGEGVKDPLTIEDLLDVAYLAQLKMMEDDLSRAMWAGGYAPVKEEWPRKSGEAPCARWVLPDDED